MPGPAHALGQGGSDPSRGIMHPHAAGSAAAHPVTHVTSDGDKTAIICLQDEHLFQVGNNGNIVQPENRAVYVLPYVYVTPFIRIKASSVPPPSIQALTAATISSTGLVFRFYSAPILSYHDESVLSGSRWYDTGASSTIKSTDSPAPLPSGRVYTPGAISNPGSLLIWQLTNNDGGVTQSFVADIFLVCRGY
jgi:hypothetical protein